MDKIIDLEAQISTLWYEVDDYIKEHKTPPDEAIKYLKMFTKMSKLLQDGK